MKSGRWGAAEGDGSRLVFTSSGEVVMLSRRRLLFTGALAGFGAAFPAKAQLVVTKGEPPPPSVPDGYGLSRALGDRSYFEDILRNFAEPAILTTEAKILGATFRITEDYSLRRPRTARVLFLPGDEGRAIAVIKDYGTRQESPSKFIEVIRFFSGQDAFKLRALIDDEERFWNASPSPPDWDALACRSRNGGQVCAPPTDGGASLLEGRVGINSHAILRQNPRASELVQQIANAVF